MTYHINDAADSPPSGARPLSNFTPDSKATLLSAVSETGRALELRRDASVIVPSEITIPATLEDAEFVLTGVAGLLTATKWGTAAIVYAFTREGGQGQNRKFAESDSLTTVEFAALGIRGLAADASVRKYRRAWQKAINEGWSDATKPGATVELPLDPFPESEPHVTHNSGENEWYTPAEYVDAARWVLGAIDLDPASSAQANKVIQAERFFSIQDDGLAQDWQGRVWMNPPYSAELIGQFTEKLAQHFDAGDVPTAIALVNNATETQWFRQLASRARAICFPDGRIKFWAPDGTVGAPLQGQAVLYLGTDTEAFIEAFQSIGWVCLVWRPE